MLARLGDQIDNCNEEAAMCRIKAITARSSELQAEYQRLEQHWRALGESLAFAERVSGFIEWKAQRLQPPPP